MKNNMSKVILEDVQEVNKDTRTLINEAFHGVKEIKEEVINEQDVPYDNTSEKFCPRCGRTYTEYPALSRYDNETYICPDCGVEEAMINYTGGTLNDPNVVKQEPADDLEECGETKSEEVTEGEDCSEECKEDLKEDEIETPTQEDLDNDDKAKKEAERKEIEDRIGELKIALDGGELSEDDVKDVQKQISELEAQLSALDECDKAINESEEDSFKYSYSADEIRKSLEDAVGITSGYEYDDANNAEFQESLDANLKNIDHIESTTPLTTISQQGNEDFPGFKGGSVKTFLKDGRVFLWSAGDEDDLSLIYAVEFVLSKEIKED